jgi:hypothetical protein
MRSALWPRPRGASSRRFFRGRDGASPARQAQPVPTFRPRCLGELRLADLLQAGVISAAEFEARRAELLARL